MFIPHQARLQALKSSTNKHPPRAKDGPQRGSQAQFSFHVCVSFPHMHAVRVFVWCLCAQSYVFDISCLNVRSLLMSNYAHLRFFK